MSRKTLMRGALAAIAAVAACASPAHAQFYQNDPCNACAVAQQPVYQTCYQTVPVTEYRQVRQTVKRPVYRTEYVEEPVTVYRPVTETRVTQVPTVNYRTVTSYRTTHRDMGRWVTHYQPVRRMSPCQYDNRPGVIGWLRRTGYEMRTAFGPRYTTRRQYVPRVVAQSCPVTRQVAVRGTRQVSYNVTRMVATRTTQKRPVQRLTYVEQEVTVMQPRTTYRTVPIGTSVAYTPYGGSSIAYAPGSAVAYAPYGTSAVASGQVISDRPVRSALTPEPDDEFSRSASSDGDKFSSRKTRDDGAAQKFRRAEPRDPEPATSGARRFERSKVRGSSATNYEPPKTSLEGDSFDEPKFDVSEPAGEFPPSAAVTRPSRYLRTGLNRSRSDSATNSELVGWRASRQQTSSSKRTIGPRLTVASR